MAEYLLDTRRQSAVAKYSSRVALRNIDPFLSLMLLAICAFGLVVLYSALARDTEMFTSQLMRICFAICVMFVAAVIPSKVYYGTAPLFYIFALVLLVGVELAGDAVRGSKRWLDLPGLPRFQPSELAKIATPLMLAFYFSFRKTSTKLIDIIAALAIVGLPAMLLFRQPDYGTAVLMVLVVGAILLVSGLLWRWVVIIAVAGCASIPILWKYVLYDYHRQRILTLFDPESDRLGAGWNIIQSKTAIGSGGLDGKGLFEGTQTQYGFLPENHTDFMLAVIGEELGFVACAILLLSYFFVFARGLFLGTTSPTTFSRLAIFGLTLMFFAYVVVNVAMVLGLLPVVGLPLPLVSFGGTSAISMLFAFGVVMSLSAQQEGTGST